MRQRSLLLGRISAARVYFGRVGMEAFVAGVYVREIETHPSDLSLLVRALKEFGIFVWSERMLHLDGERSLLTLFPSRRARNFGIHTGGTAPNQASITLIGLLFDDGRPGKLCVRSLSPSLCLTIAFLVKGPWSREPFLVATRCLFQSRWFLLFALS